MDRKNNIPERIGTQGWEQFLVSKQDMLYEYDLAKIYASSHIVKTFHGNVAESIFRKWLGNFLPKKFGITSGYIVSQRRDFRESKLPHYDVIIYNKLESPILWIEEDTDRSEQGHARAIPAEYIHAIIEVKSNLTIKSSIEAVNKISEVKHLIKGPSTTNFDGCLHKSFIASVVFFEILKENEYKKEILNNLVPDDEDIHYYYGGLILKGEGREINDTGLFQMQTFDNPLESTVQKNKESIISGSPLSDTKKIGSDKYRGTMLTWSPANFSIFAFDVIAILSGKYRPGYASSQYGMNWMNPERTK